MIFALATLALPLLLAQEPGPAGTENATQEATRSPEKLKEQIRGMRRSLILGGESVNQSETEAIRFFQGKIRSVDKRLDSIQGELAEKETSYELAMNLAGEADSASERNAALAKASQLKGEVQELRQEAKDLARSRQGLQAEISRVEGRRRDRERLASKMDTQGVEAGYTPFLSGDVGLAPAATETENPLLSDPELREDFLRRFPVRGRQMLFEADPVEYWKRWPLTPPAELLSAALLFPSPDLPGAR